MATTSRHHAIPNSTPPVNVSPPAESGPAPSPSHKRTYQACLPCRRRKVRCDLGPVDNPHDPPCVRCRRESKQCEFSATRKKRKAEREESEDGDQSGDDYATRNSRKTIKTDDSISDPHLVPQHNQRSLTAGSFAAASPLNEYNSSGHQSLQPARPYTAGGITDSGDDGENQEVANNTAAELFRSPINIPGDALHLLLKASGQSEEMQRREAESQRAHTLGRQPSSTPYNYRVSKPTSLQSLRGHRSPSNIDPAIAGDMLRNGKSAIPSDTLQTWSRLRFVRAGWFTAREGISYMTYFYEYINPLTPVSTPKLQFYADYARLLTNEPMLTITILAIASRYMKLPGPGGQTRSFMVHEKLWNYLQGMITRMLWGQEQFGGGFCGAGSQRLGQTDAIKGGLRTLGTIESLLLLNEFHPRSMHFPPTDDDDEILVPATKGNSKSPPTDDMNFGGESKIANWSEPALRSDRICWSLIGTSWVLAFELGVFGNYSDGASSTEGQSEREGRSPEYITRARRIERLLYVFIIQASGRFGLPSMYSDHVNRFTLADLQNGSLRVDNSLLPESVDKTQMLWVELMVIMKACNDQLFSSKDQTAALIESGDYVQRLHVLHPLLRTWYEKFEGLEVRKHSQCIIAIEYHYISLYINSLGLQAVLEQWSTKVNAMPQNENPASPASSISSLYMSLYSKNEPYIKEVIDSSRRVLWHVVESLLPDDQLKHAPVRTYYRIISAATFLLKTFALGGKQDEVAISLRLLDDTVRALRTSVVDDVHLCLRISDLLEGLTYSIRHQFVRLPPRPLSSPNQTRRAAQPNPDNFDINGQPINHQPDRFQYTRQNSEDVMQDPLEGIPRTYNNLHDGNITIMPPIGNAYGYTNTAPYEPAPNSNPYSPSQQQASHHPQQQAQMQPYASNDYTMPSEEDWLTLDLNPLFDPAGFNGGSDNQWFGAFGPETHNNLEVLGRLINEQQYRGDNGYGDGDGAGAGGMGYP